MIKVIQNHDDYEAALEKLEGLIDRDPDPGTPEAEDIGVLALVIRDYESKKFPKRKPDPIDAIKFRMEQQDLTQRDLVPLIGSRSKVSEVLAGKRPLTLSMIRSLHSTLGIPADVLLQEGNAADLEDSGILWRRFPIREMIKRGWINDSIDGTNLEPEDLLRRFFGPLGAARELAAFYRKTDRIRSGRKIDRYALTAWTVRIVLRARENPPKAKYIEGEINLDFMSEVARLSWSDQGPRLAREYLANHGVSLIVEPHLPRTLLDGAAIMADQYYPVIALTIRYDRLDNFWFTLMHELAHIALHFKDDSSPFYDDLDIDSQGDTLESQADDMAGEALIPQEVWINSPASQLRSPNAAQSLAKRLHINPAIVAGRMRYEFKAYRLLNQLVGHRQVRRHFQEIHWGD